MVLANPSGSYPEAASNLCLTSGIGGLDVNTVVLPLHDTATGQFVEPTALQPYQRLCAVYRRVHTTTRPGPSIWMSKKTDRRLARRASGEGLVARVAGAGLRGKRLWRADPVGYYCFACMVLDSFDDIADGKRASGAAKGGGRVIEWRARGDAGEPESTCEWEQDAGPCVLGE